MKFRFIILLALITSVLMSCGAAKYMNIADANSIVPGMKQDRVLGGVEKELTFEIADMGPKPYTVVIYKLILMSQSGELFYFFSSSSDTYDYYAVSYQNNEVYYWGFLDDYKKHNDLVIQTLGDKICDKLIEINK
jgi:hypothetical protein